MVLSNIFAPFKGIFNSVFFTLSRRILILDKNISVQSLQDNVVARPLNDAHLATLFNFKGISL